MQVNFIYPRFLDYPTKGTLNCEIEETHTQDLAQYIVTLRSFLNYRFFFVDNSGLSVPLFCIN